MPPCVGPRREVAVRPDAGEPLEVRGAGTSCPSASPQNPSGIDGNGPRADQLTLDACRRRASRPRSTCRRPSRAPVPGSRPPTPGGSGRRRRSIRTGRCRPRSRRGARRTSLRRTRTRTPRPRAASRWSRSCEASVRRWVSRGRRPAFATASMYFADTPRSVSVVPVREVEERGRARDASGCRRRARSWPSTRAPRRASSTSSSRRS